VSCVMSGSVVVAALSSSGGIVVAASSSVALSRGFGVVIVGKIIVVTLSSSVRGVVIAVVTVFIVSSLSWFLIVIIVVGEGNFTSVLGVVVLAGGGTQHAGKLLHAVLLLLRGRRMGSGRTKLSHILRMSSVSFLRSYFGGGNPMGMYIVCRAAAVGPGGSWSFVLRPSGFATAVLL